MWEEAPEASKDVWDVGEDLVANGCRESWGCCRGEFRIKCGRNELYMDREVQYPQERER